MILVRVYESVRRSVFSVWSVLGGGGGEAYGSEDGKREKLSTGIGRYFERFCNLGMPLSSH